VALIGYARVSTQQQGTSGLSLEEQTRKLLHAGAGEVLAEIGSGKRLGNSMTQRPVLRSALQTLAQGHAEGLIVASTDRLSRSVQDVLSIADMSQRQGWRLVCLDLGLDTAQPVGRLTLTVLGAVAEWERSAISERQRDAHASRRARGERWGIDAGPKTALPPETERQVLALRAAGLSMASIAQTLNADAVPTARGGQWHASTVRQVLQRAQR
jgi:DNA invertase Pin-like site-specific DNA recombinase